MRVDLHCHSTASDGTLAPAAVVRRAHEQGVSLLALTDHDTTAGVAEAAAEAAELGLRLVPGIELSAAWRGKSMHIVGLHLDPDHAALQAHVGRLAGIRRERAEAIGAKLAKAGVTDAYAEACALAASPGPTRTHFARVLVARGCVSDMNQAFKRYLGQGKAAHVAVEWPTMEETIAIIRGAGGVAVLAHPMSHRWTAAWMRRILEAFVAAGGSALEVVSGHAQPKDVLEASGYARRFSLRASMGSDFHTPDYPWIELGRLPPLPEDLVPVWAEWLAPA